MIANDQELETTLERIVWFQKQVAHLGVRSWWLLAPLAIPTAILVYGVALAYDGPIGSAPDWREAVIEALILCNLPASLVLPWLLPGIRLMAVGASAVGLWLSVCAGTMASMSVTNIWP